MTRSRRSTSPPGPHIRIVVVEHRAIVGIGVREILDREPDIDIVAYVQTPDEAMSAIDGSDPDVVLVDVEFQPPEVTEATLRLHQGAPESFLVVMGGDDAASIVGAMAIGATAHVASSAEPAELVSTIRRVADGEDPLKAELISRPDLVERILDDIRESLERERPPIQPLSPREFEVLTHVAAGLKNRDIAETLGVGEQTVKNHLSSILHKLGVPNRTHAVMYGVRQGWLVIDDIHDESTVGTGRSS